MTPERLTGLGALLLEFRDWVLEVSEDAPLDVVHIEHVVDVIGIYRRMLVQELSARAASSTGAVKA